MSSRPTVDRASDDVLRAALLKGLEGGRGELVNDDWWAETRARIARRVEAKSRETRIEVAACVTVSTTPDEAEPRP